MRMYDLYIYCWEIIHAYTLLLQNDNPRPAFLAAIHFNERLCLETAANTCPGTSTE